jgi:hypothetical protein
MKKIPQEIDFWLFPGMMGSCLVAHLIAHFEKIQDLPDILRETFSKSDHI